MATLTTSFPTVAFPFELDTLEFSKNDPKQDVFKVRLEVNGVAVLDVSQCFGNESTLQMFDIASLLNDYITTEAAEVSIYVDETFATSTLCLPCRVMVDAPAEEFLPKHFLNRLRGEKFTHADSTEYLSFYADGAFEVKVSAIFCDESGNITNVQRTVTRGNEVQQMVEISIKVKDILELKEENLLSFTVMVGERQQTYSLLPLHPGLEQMVFFNAFGQKDTLHFDDIIKKTNPDIHFAKVLNREINYLVKPNIVYTGTNSYISDEMADLAEDFLLSREIIRMRDNVSMRLKDGEILRNYGGYAANTLKANWTEAAAVPVFAVPRKIKTFDLTFDNTFL